MKPGERVVFVREFFRYSNHSVVWKKWIKLFLKRKSFKKGIDYVVKPYFIDGEDSFEIIMKTDLVFKIVKNKSTIRTENFRLLYEMEYSLPWTSGYIPKNLKSEILLNSSGIDFRNDSFYDHVAEMNINNVPKKNYPKIFRSLKPQITAKVDYYIYRTPKNFKYSCLYILNPIKTYDILIEKENCFLVEIKERSLKKIREIFINYDDIATFRNKGIQGRYIGKIYLFEKDISLYYEKINPSHPFILVYPNVV